MDRIRLTNQRIEQAICAAGKSQSFIFDTEVPRLAVRVTPAGVKAFVFESKLHRKTIRLTIGKCNDWPLEDARREARRLQTMIDQGVDPRTQKAERIEQARVDLAEKKRGAVTVKDAWLQYIEDRRPKWSERHYIDHLRMVQPGGDKYGSNGIYKPGPLAPLMGLTLADLTPARVRTWAAAEASKRGTQARLAFDALRAFVNWAADHADYAGIVDTETCSKRTRSETMPKKKAKDDCLQREQLAAWFTAVRGLQNPVVSVYLQGLLLTGARRNELAGLKWADVDFKWGGAMTIHDKVDGERKIPLPPYLGLLLSALPRRNEFVFSSPTAASGRLEEPRRQHLKAQATAGIEGLTIHGLRRSFGTLSEWVECPVGVVAQIMGHKPSAIAEKHYRRRPLDLLRMWHEKIEAWILEQAGIEQPAGISDEGLRVVK